MKWALIILTFLGSQVSNADPASDALARLFTKARVTANSHLSAVMEGACEQTVAQTHVLSCDEKNQKHTSVDQLAKSLKAINLVQREQVFVAKAFQEQISSLTCEIDQLRALYNEESVKPFYGTILSDLCSKLPELKVRWQKITDLQKLINSGNSKLAQARHMNNYSVPVSNAEILSTSENVKKWSKDLQYQQSVFLQVKGSLWRSEDPGMDAFIHQGMSSKTEQDSICDGGSSGESYEKYYLARAKFQESIILPMIQRAQDDLFSIGKSASEVGVAGMKVLLNKSNLSSTLEKTEDLSNAVMMCEREQKYTRGDDRTQSFLTVGSFALGGAGAFLKLARFATILKPQAIQGLLFTSRVAMMASAFPSIPVSLEQVNDSCFGGGQSYDLKGMVCPYTSTGNIDLKKMVEIETTKIERDNCALSVTLATVELAPGVESFVKSFKNPALMPILRIQSLKYDSEFAKLFSGKSVYPEQHSDIAAAIEALSTSNPKLTKIEIRKKIEQRMNVCE